MIAPVGLTVSKRQKWKWVGVAMPYGVDMNSPDWRPWAVWQHVGGDRDGVSTCVMPYSWLFPNSTRRQFRVSNRAQDILGEYGPSVLRGFPEKRELFW